MKTPEKYPGKHDVPIIIIKYLNSLGMKRIILAFMLLMVINYRAAAQEVFKAEEFDKHLGKTGTLCDTVKSLKIVNDTLTMLYMVNSYPNQKYTVYITGTKINLDWTSIKGKKLCITGVFELYNKEPGIQVAEPDRVTIQ